MAVRRAVNPELIASLTEATKTQTVASNFSKTLDEKFPVWATPVDKEFVIYIPKGPTCKEVDGELVFDPAIAHVHNGRAGNTFTTFRCMKNIDPTIGAQLGYTDGECPVCKALSECYDKYNTQLKMRAGELQLDPTDEKNNDALRPVREALRNEMAITKPMKKYIVPIVVISDTGIIPQTVEADKLQPYFFPISESAYNKKLMKPLQDQYVPINNPAGMFFKLNYKYQVANGGKPNARDAAREMTITPIIGADEVTSKFVEVCENLTKDFTSVQANTSVTEIAFSYAEDVIKEVDNLMVATRAFNASVAATGTPEAPALGTTANATGNSLGNALSAFGVQTTLPDNVVANNGAVTAAPAPAVAPAVPASAPASVAPTMAGFGAPTGQIDLNGNS